jgi:hypothetical protein
MILIGKLLHSCVNKNVLRHTTTMTVFYTIFANLVQLFKAKFWESRDILAGGEGEFLV